MIILGIIGIILGIVGVSHYGSAISGYSGSETLFIPVLNIILGSICFYLSIML